MTPVTAFLPAWEMIIKTFDSILDLLYEPLHQVLPFYAMDMMRHAQPPAYIIVRSGAACEYRFSTISITQLLEEPVTSTAVLGLFIESLRGTQVTSAQMDSS